MASENSWRTDVDQQLGVLSTEVSGIKTQLRDQGQMLGKIFSRLDEVAGRQGPGIGQILTTTLTILGIVGGAATGITILVTSFVSPTLTKLETQGTHLNAVVSQLLDERVDEFKRLKKSEREVLDERLTRLEEKVARKSLAWAPTVSAD